MLQYLAFGDSYTIGEAVPEKQRWPVQLVEKLRSQGTDVEYPKIIATTGWTSGELLAAIEKENPASSYHLVSLLIGVNNQYRGYDLDLFREEFTSLVQKAIFYARKRTEGVFVLSIPDYGVTPFAAEKNPPLIAKEIEEYNKLSQHICQRLDVAWYNITDISKGAGSDHNLLAEDGLHPSGSMYAAWVEQIYPYVVKQIRLLQKV
ncbi:SGNH/GDSL hydrolase family protein [Cesiribacter sp. SM1]|uniref:SGNH/GDSL hydrolase family protein n=1 Tax=Cesiribacter sp. SM1 TaxID=2861196 RepID=UPI001CD51884|nr:SGNH/GDSL hydrolase family protein [Cesiribacter sp. SM1]